MAMTSRQDDPPAGQEPVFLADWLDMDSQLRFRGAYGRRARQIRVIPFYDDWVPILLSFAILFNLGVPDYLFARVEFVDLDSSRATLQLWFLLMATALGVRIGWMRRLLFELEVRSDERRRTWRRFLERQAVPRVGGGYARQRVNLILAIFLSTIILLFVALSLDSIRADIVYLVYGIAEPAFERSPGVISVPDALFATLIVLGVDWIVFFTHLFTRKPTVSGTRRTRPPKE